MDLKHPQWQEPFAKSILEFNPQHLREKVQRAEEAIAKRIEELALEQGELPSEILTCPKGRAHVEPVVAYTALVRDQMKQVNPWLTAGQFRPAFGTSHKKVTQIAIVLLELRMDFAISMAKLCKDLPTA